MPVAASTKPISTAETPSPSIQPEEKTMPGPLSNLFGSDDGAESEGATRVPVSTIDGSDSDSSGDGSQHQQSFHDNGDGGDSDGAPAFTIDATDPGTPDGPSGDWLEPQ
jgi:hypothetical protein